MNKTLKCSTISKSRTRTKTCLSLKDLEQITGKRGSKDVLIKHTENVIKRPLYKAEKDLYKYIKLPEKLEYDIKYMLYKPSANSPNRGLYTTEMNQVLKQIFYKIDPKEKKYKFLGTYPADYHGVNIPKNINSGIVFNTDPSYKSGTHWVAISIHPKANTVYYFDSFGKPPNHYISKFLKNIPYKLRVVSNKPFQKEDGLCGLYALNFLLCKAESKEYCFENTDKEIKKIFNVLIK
jgi:hypothetical protein